MTPFDACTVHHDPLVGGRRTEAPADVRSHKTVGQAAGKETAVMASTTIRKKGPGGRPEKAESERRCKQTNTRWTIAEFAHLHEQAAAANLSVGEFIRRRALLLPVTPPPQRCDARLLHELNAIGNNVNQIARNLNSDRAGGRGVEWSAVQVELRRLLKKVGAAIQ